MNADAAVKFGVSEREADRDRKPSCALEQSRHPCSLPVLGSMSYRHAASQGHDRDRLACKTAPTHTLNALRLQCVRVQQRGAHQSQA